MNTRDISLSNALTEKQREFLAAYVRQPQYRRDPISAYQLIYPSSTRVAKVYSLAMEILDSPTATQFVATITGGVDIEKEGLNRDEIALEMAFQALQTSQVGIERRQALKTYSDLSKAFRPKETQSNGETVQSGALGAALESINVEIGEKLGNSE